VASIADMRQKLLPHGPREDCGGAGEDLVVQDGSVDLAHHGSRVSAGDCAGVALCPVGQDVPGDERVGFSHRGFLNLRRPAGSASRIAEVCSQHQT
jgi:hypothetical protein